MAKINIDKEEKKRIIRYFIENVFKWRGANKMIFHFKLRGDFDVDAVIYLQDLIKIINFEKRKRLKRYIFQNGKKYIIKQK